MHCERINRFHTHSAVCGLAVAVPGLMVSVTKSCMCEVRAQVWTQTCAKGICNHALLPLAKMCSTIDTVAHSPGQHARTRSQRAVALELPDVLCKERNLLCDALPEGWRIG